MVRCAAAARVRVRACPWGQHPSVLAASSGALRKCRDERSSLAPDAAPLHCAALAPFQAAPPDKIEFKAYLKATGLDAALSKGAQRRQQREE
jgi:hypothetical protein